MESKLKSPAIWLLAVSFTVTIITLAIFLVESGFSDESLFLLLSILRYSSFLMCISSVYIVVSGIRSIIRKPSVLPIFSVIITFCLALFGLGIILVDAFILSIAGGNG